MSDDKKQEVYEVLSEEERGPIRMYVLREIATGNIIIDASVVVHVRRTISALEYKSLYDPEHAVANAKYRAVLSIEEACKQLIKDIHA